MGCHAPCGGFRGGPFNDPAAVWSKGRRSEVKTVDLSELDLRYFVDAETYNCPFCNRRNVVYVLLRGLSFDWSETKQCHVYFVRCSSCNKTSMHLSYDELSNESRYDFKFKKDVDLDANIFYSVPTSFFVMDARIPEAIRELVTEAEGSLKMNFLTGASACMRKAIYELLVVERISGTDYETRIKALKEKYPSIDAELFDVLGHIQNMTSDKVHEQSWDKWDSRNLRLIIDTLKAVLRDIYVEPDERKQRTQRIARLREEISKTGRTKSPRTGTSG